MRATIATAVLVIVCASLNAQDTRPDISGAADKVKATPDGKGASIYVEAPKEAKFTYDKAMIRVNEKTKIQKMNGKLVEDAKVDEIRNGVKVSVWFTGPVAESYPVQATAGRILIFPVKKEKE